MKKMKDIENSENEYQNMCVSSTDDSATIQKSNQGTKRIKINIPSQNHVFETVNAIIEPNVKLRDILHKLNLPSNPLYYQIYRPLKKEVIRDNNVELFSVLEMDETIEIIPRSPIC
jgi:hypothetical protein